MRIMPLVFLVMVAACSKKKEEGAPAGDPKAAPGVTAPAPAPEAPAPAPTPTASATKLTCDKIFPKELRDKYFAGAEITDNPQPVDFTGECKTKKGDAEGVVNVSCHDNVSAAMQGSIDGLKKAIKETKDLPGVGKGAIIVDMGKIAGKQMPVQVTAWDDNSNCNVHVAAPEGVDATALAKDMLATLPLK
jgi:hypothetical protein